MKVAVRVQAAVFTAYALRFDALAATHLLRTTWYLAANRMAIGSALGGLFHFATGLPYSLQLRLASPPQLACSGVSEGPSRPDMQAA